MAELDLDPRCTASRPPPSAPRLLCVLPSSFPLSAWVSIWLFGLFYHSLGTLSVFVSCPSTPEVFEVGDCDCPSWYLRDSIAQDAGSCQSLGFIYVTSILKHLLEQVYRWVPKRPSPQVFSTRCVFCGFQQMGCILERGCCEAGPDPWVGCPPTLHWPAIYSLSALWSLAWQCRFWQFSSSSLHWLNYSVVYSKTYQPCLVERE